MNRILVSTVSWTDKNLIASRRFYPRKCNSPEDRLGYYALQFPLVEVDSSSYANAGAAGSAAMDRTLTEFHIQHRGVPPFHRAPNIADGIPERYRRDVGTLGKEETLLQESAARADRSERGRDINDAPFGLMS